MSLPTNEIFLHASPASGQHDGKYYSFMEEKMFSLPQASNAIYSLILK
jgi:hypothetical protein